MGVLITDGGHDPGGDRESVHPDQGTSESLICPSIWNFYELGPGEWLRSLGLKPPD